MYTVSQKMHTALLVNISVKSPLILTIFDIKNRVNCAYEVRQFSTSPEKCRYNKQLFQHVEYLVVQSWNGKNISVFTA